ncbi:hypothetical protein E1176_08475 [Fulvivirga sp. RKSG066]|uniref:hypothetical protein n=1 Tax=Fulvivirga aurantia TaxID=2529383 RepID=UPI0012BCF627|nr:hypothetical protein [Fulvivirga aurantia]MTI21051.1 hypothetical protein [Fulvivirga aurantia]
MRLVRSLAIITIIHLSFGLQAQLVGEMDDESKLYAETKQVNQFFRRFNGEEDEKGNRYYPKDKRYRQDKLRKKYLEILFDNSNTNLDKAIKKEFVDAVIDRPAFLDFHKDSWFAEVNTTFTLNGKQENIKLFLKLEKAHKGTQWDIFKIHSDTFMSHFKRDTSKVQQFLHPLSHELDFMNLRKAFANKDSVSQFTERSFQPDQLSIFVYEISRGALKFETVNDVKFHFFQIDNWYFELSQFNRDGYNRGWLISNLTKLKSAQDEAILKKYLFYEN